MWTHTGARRPSFADAPAAGQESVWDYPRPPALHVDVRRVVVCAGNLVIADSTRTMRVLETASPPTFYIPPDDIDMTRLTPAGGSSMCEWKGHAAYWTVSLSDDARLDAVGWSYPSPTLPFATIAGWLSFYPGRLECTVDGERVRAQPGGFYGGWLTDEIAGPVKGLPGTGHW